MNVETRHATYAAPTLTVYGSVAALTASGTGTSCEHRGNSSNCKPTDNQPDRRP